MLMSSGGGGGGGGGGHLFTLRPSYLQDCRETTEFLAQMFQCSSTDLPAAALLSLRYINSKPVRLELCQNISQDRPNLHSHCQPQTENIFNKGNISEFPLTAGAGGG